MGLHSLRLGSFPDEERGHSAMDEVKQWLNWFCTRSSFITYYSYNLFFTQLSSPCFSFQPGVKATSRALKLAAAFKTI